MNGNKEMIALRTGGYFMKDDMKTDVAKSMDSFDIIQIINEGEKKGLSPYEALKEKGIIRNPKEEFFSKNYKIRE